MIAESNECWIASLVATGWRIDLVDSFSSASIASADELGRELSENFQLGSARSVMIASIQLPSASLSQVSSHQASVTRSPNQ